MAHTDREERAARNEALFREVNDRIGELNEAFAQFTDVYEIACECSNIECIAVLTIGRTEYLVARQSPQDGSALDRAGDRGVDVGRIGFRDGVDDRAVIRVPDFDLRRRTGR